MNSGCFLKFKHVNLSCLAYTDYMLILCVINRQKTNTSVITSLFNEQIRIRIRRLSHVVRHGWGGL